MSGFREFGGTVVEGISRAKLDRVEQRVEESLENVRTEVSRRIESLAEQIHNLGQRLENPEEAQRIARELERTADYLRYRRAGDMFADSVDVVRRHRVTLLAGIAAGTLAVALVVRRRRPAL